MTAGTERANARPGRWRLNRGGIVNIWQYDEQEFDFSGGRAVFQGTNGSGKSRTLELLLPLCLDGDLRHLGSKGFDTVSVRRLMLDDYSGGANRIGYAWIELTRIDAEGVREFLTCGIGIKASASSQQVSDSWRFVTPARVGRDFLLAGPDRVPLGPVQLREEIGADRVLDDAAFRATVAELVYGMPAGRYADLLHLQRTLRNPDVGLKVLEGQLEQILSDALPPLDPAMIEQLATSFEDLESIRENITRLSAADTALSAFLTTYSGYALARLRDAGERARAAAEASRAERARADELADRLARDTRRHDEAVTRVERQQERDEELERAIDALRELPAYRGMRDLVDRERLVAAARTAATSALEAAAKHRTRVERAVDTVCGALRRLGRDTEAAAELISLTQAGLSAAGLDPALCPRIPTAVPAEPGVTTELARAKPDPEAAPVEIERRTPPEVSLDVYDATLRSAAEQAQRLGATVTQRCALTLALHERARQLDHRVRTTEGLRQAARQAQLDSTEAAGRRNEATQRLADAAADWSDRVNTWLATGPFANGDGNRPPSPPTPDILRTEPSAARTAQQAAQSWVAVRLRGLRQAAMTAQQAAGAIAARIAVAEAELAAVRGGTDVAAPLPPYVTAHRDPTRGAPFYRLVDFAPGVNPADQAGLEAALQSSGLLTAWVSADGAVNDPPMADVLALPGGRSGGVSGLAAVLVPAAEPDCPVPTEVITAVLNAVTLGTPGSDGETATGLVVWPDGHWRSGVLTGGMSKPEAEFVGAGARAAARRRRIDELDADLRALRAEREMIESERAEHAERVSVWERHVEAFPDDRALIAAHATLTTATRTAADAAGRANRLRAEHEAADQRHQAETMDLAQTAAHAGLPADIEILRRAHEAATETRGTIERLREALLRRCVSAVTDVAEALRDHQAAVNDLDESTRVADVRCGEFTREASALAELTSAVGGDAEDIAEQLARLEAQRRKIRAELPGLRSAATELSNQVVRTETTLAAARAEITRGMEAAAAADQAFRDALAAPGVCRAALGDVTVPDELDAALAMLTAMERKPASEELVITTSQALRTSLTGSHDITAQRYAGILTVTVTGDHGPRPVADAAREVAERLAEQRGYLGERYQDIFATFMLRNLAERLHTQLAVAEDLTRRMNDMLDVARSSQGVHVQLEWQPSAALSESTLEAVRLVRTPFAERTPEQDEALRRAFTERIEAERDAHSRGYAEILTRALDYRSWYSFTVRVRDTGPDGKPRTRRLRQLSSGETRLVSYVTLFAAAAAFYDAISGPSDDFGPLRVVLLDEAFERLDDPTIARMLALLVDLEMDWIITWPSGWGVSEKIPRMHIYDVLRPKSGHGIACTHTTWDGVDLASVDL